MLEFELGILNYIQDNITNPIFDKIMPVITVLGEHGLFPIVLAIILMIPKKTRQLGLSMAFALLLGFITGNVIIKNIVARARPYEYNSEITLLVSKLKDYSFPSGHAMVFFEIAVCTFIRHKKLGIAALAFAALMAFSRLYLYVHFPSDVLCGTILGIVFGIIGSLIANRIYKKKNTLSKKSIID